MWRRHFPGTAEPPVWITLQLLPGSREGRRHQRFSLVTFRVWEPHALSWPQRFPMTDADVAALLAGAPVDRDRGDDQPWPVEPDPEPVWRVAWTILLPRPEGMDRGCIAATPPWWRCLARQVIPRHATRDCCYYHQVNWRQVSAAAIRVTRQARRERLAGEAFGDRVAVLAAAQGLPKQEEEALADLLTDHSAIQPGPRFRLRAGYINGRHRTTAMLDAGVRRTIIVRWRYPSLRLDVQVDRLPAAPPPVAIPCCQLIRQLIRTPADGGARFQRRTCRTRRKYTFRCTPRLYIQVKPVNNNP